MVFSSTFFIFFFLTAVLVLDRLLPRRFRNPMLFLFSLVFYGYGEPVYILLMMVSITLNYVSGLLMGRFAGSPRKRKAVLVCCVAVNLLLLGWFKYTGMILDTLRQIPVLSFLPSPEIALPIGISFYTFQTMSYVIDVYRGNCAPQKNYITFGTYVALFPQLIAGPIVRYVDVEQQLMYREETREKFAWGVRVFLVGLGKKVLLANQMGIVWDRLKFAGEANGILGAWVGVTAFSIQIYFDFSGYSDMARGMGAMLGFDFVKNFDYPYLSRSVTEFWRRWHMSLGTWFREYLYIPLGGNRRGKARQCLNILIVWTLTGLWHGASWNFLLWGLYFGALLILERLFLLPRLQKAPALGHLYCMLAVTLSWVLFEFTNLGEMGRYFSTMFTLKNGIIGPDAAYLALSYLPLFLVSILACTPVVRHVWERCHETLPGRILELGGAALILLLSTASLVVSSYNPFLYLRF